MGDHCKVGPRVIVEPGERRARGKCHGPLLLPGIEGRDLSVRWVLGSPEGPAIAQACDAHEKEASRWT
jgi:hypothetical protein